MSNECFKDFHYASERFPIQNLKDLFKTFWTGKIIFSFKWYHNLSNEKLGHTNICSRYFGSKNICVQKYSDKGILSWLANFLYGWKSWGGRLTKNLVTFYLQYWWFLRPKELCFEGKRLVMLLIYILRKIKDIEIMKMFAFFSSNYKIL